MIGIFDSGSGGLTVLRALKKRAPQADILYFGDTLNAPYGSRTPEELSTLTISGVRTLEVMGADDLISACNSVAASVLAGAVGHARIIDMTRPTARAMRRSAGKRVLLLATPATVRSGLYAHALDVIVVLDSLPVENLAGAIESGRTDPEIALITRAALKEREGQRYDLILLGCTHYPLVRPIIEEEARKLFGPIECVDPADAVAEEAAERFSLVGDGRLQFRISKESPGFRRRVAMEFPGSEWTIEVV